MDPVATSTSSYSVDARTIPQHDVMKGSAVSMKPDFFSETAKAVPPLAVIAVQKTGLTLQDWVFIATLLYIALQAGWLVWRWWRAARSANWVPRD
jgi:hypothetical protein